MKKRTIKFLRQAEKSDTGKKKMGRKKPKKDKEGEMEDASIEVDKVLSMKSLRAKEEDEEEDESDDNDDEEEEEEVEEDLFSMAVTMILALVCHLVMLSIILVSPSILRLEIINGKSFNPSSFNWLSLSRIEA